MKQLLPISESPSVKTCIHYAYPCAIMESELLARVIFEDAKSYFWNAWNENVIRKESDGSIEFSLREFGKKYSSYIWKTCKKNEDIELCIDYFKEIHLSRCIDILVYYGNEKDEIEAEYKQCSIRWNQYGLFIGKEMHSFDTKIYKYIKTCIYEDDVEFLTSTDGKKWESVKRIDLPNHRAGDLKYMVSFNWGEDTYKAWKNMNFVQLLYNKDDPYRGITLDYYFFPRKNYDNAYGYYQNYLETNYDFKYDYYDCFETLNDFIVWNIRHGFYVCICLDEYCLPGRRCYKSFHYNHYNLVYGFDTDEKVYYVMGFEDDVILSKIPFDTISYETLQSEKIVRYRYRINDDTDYSFSKEGLARQLREFVMSTYSAGKFDNLLTGENLNYGIDILQIFRVSDEEKRKLYKDKRISYLILEHSILMKERVEYVYSEGLLTEDEYKKLMWWAENVVAEANSLLVNVLKCIVSGALSEKVLRNIDRIYEAYKEMCMFFVGCLEKTTDKESGYGK